MVLGAEVADLPHDPQRSLDPLLERSLDRLGQLRDRETVGLGDRREAAALTPSRSPGRASARGAIGIEGQSLPSSTMISCSGLTPMTDTANALTTNIAAVPGVGPSRAAAFRTLGVRSVADLIRHLPARYEEEHAETSIAAIGEAIGAEHGGEQNVALRGEVLTTRVARGRRTRFEATLTDGSATALLTWFNAPWMRKKLLPGTPIRASGRAKRYGDTIQLVNPPVVGHRRDATGSRAAGWPVAPGVSRHRAAFLGADRGNDRACAR